MLHSQKADHLAIGFVVWFNPRKGYGFIRPDRGGPDIFVHKSAVEKAGLTSVPAGARVSYEIVSTNGKLVADNLDFGSEGDASRPARS